jgi:hypothetical protein
MIQNMMLLNQIAFHRKIHKMMKTYQSSRALENGLDRGSQTNVHCSLHRASGKSK